MSKVFVCVLKSVEVKFPFSCVCEINCFFVCVFSVWHECIADLTDTRQFTLVVEVTKIYFTDIMQECFAFENKVFHVRKSIACAFKYRVVFSLFFAL